MDGKNFFFNVSPRPDGGFNVSSATGGEHQFDQFCETAAETVAACEAWTTNVPPPATSAKRG